MVLKQLDLFSQPSFNVTRELKVAMAGAASRSGLSREELCDRLNQLADRYAVRLVKGNGRYLTLATLEKWLNKEDEERVIPVKALSLFCAVVADTSPLEVLIRPLGARMIDERQAKLLEWAEHYQEVKRTRAKMKQIEAEL